MQNKKERRKRETKTIRITCKGAGMLALEKLKEFQGGLKKLSNNDYEKLKKTIIDEGFSFPFFIWKNRGNNYMIDGHQRKATIQRMMKEGWRVEGMGKLPVDWIEARNGKEAKKKILLAMSQYGKYTEDGLMEFITDAGLDLEALSRSIDIPMIDIDKYLEENKGEGEKPEVEFSEELLENHNYIVLYFDNDVDWLQAQTLLNLKRYKPLHAKPGFNVTGIGRVIEGPEAIERLRKTQE
jgi:hypothetical protein